MPLQPSWSGKTEPAGGEISERPRNAAAAGGRGGSGVRRRIRTNRRPAPAVPKEPDWKGTKCGPGREDVPFRRLRIEFPAGLFSPRESVYNKEQNMPRRAVRAAVFHGAEISAPSSGYRPPGSRALFKEAAAFQAGTRFRERASVSNGRAACPQSFG